LSCLEDVREAAIAAGLPTVRAETFISVWGSASKPALLLCDDKNRWVVKGIAHARRQAVNDHVVGRLGLAAGAPVGRVGLVDLPQDLIDSEAELAHFTAGWAHGSLFMTDVSDDRRGLEHLSVPENIPRFAALAQLFGWVQANDCQYLYSTTPPHIVYSVDHGHFFAGGPEWTESSLAAAPPAAVDPLAQTCNLPTASLDAACQAFKDLSDDDIASAVGTPPDSWNLTLEERVALGCYLSDRRHAMFGD
jgi:hypothetical protein